MQVRFKREKETRGRCAIRRSMRTANPSRGPGPRSACSTFAKAPSGVGARGRRSYVTVDAVEHRNRN